MAFLLRYVSTAERRPPGLREIERVLDVCGPLTTRPAKGKGEQSHYYQNPDTRVHCRFVSYESHNPHEIGLEFEMIQPTPTFFALEALPLAVSVARELKVEVVAVEPGPPTRPFRPSTENLLVLWQEGNRQAVKELTDDGHPPAFCSSEALEDSWEYMTLFPEMRRRYGKNGMQVPPIRLLLRKSDGRVLRVVSWKHLGPVIMPETDLVELVNPPSPLEDGRLYDSEELVEACRPHVREISQPIFHYIFDKDRAPEGMVDAVHHLSGRTARQFEPIDFDQVTDETV
jgi:hypothetical protein